MVTYVITQVAREATHLSCIATATLVVLRTRVADAKAHYVTFAKREATKKARENNLELS